MQTIGSSTEIQVVRQEAHFDRACDTAHRSAISYFGIDDDGHSRYVRGWERSCCWIEIVFNGYVRIGNEHIYKFTAKTAKLDESDEGE